MLAPVLLIPLLGVSGLTVALVVYTGSVWPLIPGLVICILGFWVTHRSSRNLQHERDELAALHTQLTATQQELAQLLVQSQTTEAALGTAQESAVHAAAAVQAHDRALAERSLKALAEVATNVEQFALDVAQAQEFTTAALDQALQGVSVVGSVSLSVAQAAESVNQATATMRDLEQRSANIDDVVGLIKDIANQTKLIALNAAMEAARAGSHGRGFAVVADAVRLLAEQTGKATTEISRMIASIQHDTAHSFRYLQEAHIQVASGVKAASQAQTTLQRIHDTADQVVQTIDSLAEAAHLVSTANSEATELTGRIGSTTPHE